MLFVLLVSEWASLSGAQHPAVLQSHSGVLSHPLLLFPLLGWKLPLWSQPLCGSAHDQTH